MNEMNTCGITSVTLNCDSMIKQGIHSREMEEVCLITKTRSCISYPKVSLGELI